MKRFHLQSVLEYRQSLEEEAQREFSELQSNLVREVELGSRIQGQIAAWQEKFRGRQHQSIYSAEIDLYQKFLSFLTDEAARQREKIRSLELAVEEKRQILLEARKEKKIMDRLKEKTLSLWEKEMLKEEQKTLDERAIRRGRRILNDER
ncbi:MAG: flagellar export protein FliJ [bacterium]